MTNERRVFTVISPSSRDDVHALGARLSKPDSDHLEDQATVIDRGLTETKVLRNQNGPMRRKYYGPRKQN